MHITFQQFNEKLNTFDIIEYLTNNREFFKQEYTNFWGDDFGSNNNFDSEFDRLINTDFFEGGFKNTPSKIKLSRLITTTDFINENNLCWIRTSDEELFNDDDWLFLTDILINENTKIIRTEVDNSYINWEDTIIQNLTFPHEKEIRLKKRKINNYKIIDFINKKD